MQGFVKLLQMFINIKLLKTQSSKLVQLGEFLIKLLGRSLKTPLPLRKNSILLVTLAASILGNALGGKGVTRGSERVIRAG